MDFTNIGEPGTGYSVPKVVITVKVSLRVVKNMFFSRKDSTCFLQGFFFDTAFKSRNDTFGVQVYCLLILVLSTRRIFPHIRNY